MTGTTENLPETSEKCLSCQYETTWRTTGEWPSEAARNHWTLWGCTCQPQDEERVA